MSDHTITITVASSSYLRAECSCKKFAGEAWSVTLDDLNAAAHDHIESSERVGEVDAVTTGHGGYRVESLVRSADELIDLEHP